MKLNINEVYVSNKRKKNAMLGTKSGTWYVSLRHIDKI